MAKIFTLAALLLLLVSCEKDLSTEQPKGEAPQEIPLHHVRALIDGKIVLFTAFSQASRHNVDGQHILSLFSKVNRSAESTDRINMGISSQKAFDTLTYKSTDPLPVLYVDAVYNANGEVWGVSKLNTTDPFRITILHIDDTEVTGTFQGTLYNDSGRGSKRLAIAQGEFTLPF